jgi:hypothetical protein
LVEENMHKGLSGALGIFVRAALPAFCCAIAVTGRSEAAWLYVETTSMAFSNDSLCSLPEAIHAVNNLTAVDDCGAGDEMNDTIVLDNAVYVVPSTLTIARSVRIVGWGVGFSTVRANLGSGSELFLVVPGPNQETRVEFEDMTIDRAGTQGSPNVTGIYAVSSNPAATLYLMLARTRVAGHTWAGVYGDGAEIHISDSTIEGNHSPWAGGGVAANNFGDPNNGGTRGTLWIEHSTINDNTTSSGGGGVYFSGRGTSKLLNSTVSNNHASLSGGGLWLNSESEYFITEFSTITKNGGGQTGGGVYHTGFGNYCFNSIIAYNVAHSIGQDWDGDATFMQNTLVGDSFGLNILNDLGGNLLDADPLLDYTLQNLGGYTKVHALLPGSPAIDHIEGGDPIDQRHWARGIDGNGIGQATEVDIGAFEYYPF